MRRIPASLLPIALVLSLTACAAAKDYPSLARRPAERMTGTAQAVTPQPPPPPPAPPSPHLTTRLAQLVAQARAADRRFAARRGSAERLVAAGAAAARGSESWAVATVALAGLESARSDTMVALAELDQLYADETVAAAETGNPGNVAAITTARDQVTALVGEEDDVLARLRGRMAG